MNYLSTFTSDHNSSVCPANQNILQWIVHEICGTECNAQAFQSRPGETAIKMDDADAVTSPANPKASNTRFGSTALACDPISKTPDSYVIAPADLFTPYSVIQNVFTAKYKTQVKWG